MGDVELFDTTARDGTQGEIALSPDQKAYLARKLHRFAKGMIIEVSYAAGDIDPKSVYDIIRESDSSLANVITTFGSTHKPKVSVEQCENVQKMLASGAEIATIFGKTWLSHVRGLGVSPEKYLEVIQDTVGFLKKNGMRRVIYDAEHFFSGFKDDPEYAVATLEAAVNAGADTTVFCDTKGGNTPWDIIQTMHGLESFITANPSVRLGIHPHNDIECAVGNALTFVEMMKDKAEKLQVQGTINGYGERCGNGNLISIIPTLIEKKGIPLDVSEKDLKKLATEISVLTGMPLDPRASYVGDLAFAHKGGIHIFSEKRGMSYTHTDPGRWGNAPVYLLTSQSGREMYQEMAAKYGYDVKKGSRFLNKMKKRLEMLERHGYRIHASPAEHLILVHSIFEGDDDLGIRLKKWRTISEFRQLNSHFLRESETKLVGYDEDSLVSANEYLSETSQGPVDSIYMALQKGLTDDGRKYPYLNNIELVDFKVGITRYEKDRGSASAVIAYITFKEKDNGHLWTTQGVSENILESSLKAIIKGFRYKVLTEEVEQYKLAK